MKSTWALLYFCPWTVRLYNIFSHCLIKGTIVGGILQRIQQDIFINVYKVKVECTLVQALSLCTDRTAHRGSRVIALLFNDHGTRRG